MSDYETPLEAVWRQWKLRARQLTFLTGLVALEAGARLVRKVVKGKILWS